MLQKLILSCVVAIGLFGETKIAMFTEHYPPNNMRVKGKLTGVTVDILDAMLKQMHSKQSIDEVRLTNWSRAYSIALRRKNAMVFSTVRTNSREKLFKWVGPICKTVNGLIALKSRHIKINSISELNNYKIGAVLKDVGELLLLENGVKKENIKYVKGENAINLSFKQMQNRRIDLFSYDAAVAFTNAKTNGLNPKNYEVVYVLQKGELYYAFNKNTDDKIIKKWQKALDTIKANGTYQKILKKYNIKE